MVYQDVLMKLIQIIQLLVDIQIEIDVEDLDQVI